MSNMIITKYAQIVWNPYAGTHYFNLMVENIRKFDYAK
jgi:hypothetical protein